MPPQKIQMTFGCGGSRSRNIWASTRTRSRSTSPRAVSQSPKWPANYAPKPSSSAAKMGAHARMLRSLINIIPGGPCVLVNCHPVKNATEDNLLPAGGGTFLNEVDGNLTCAKNDSVTEMHWQGKFRGAEFAAMSFLIKTVTHQDLKDSDGRLLPTVICEHIGEQAREEIAEAGRQDENTILA